MIPALARAVVGWAFTAILWTLVFALQLATLRSLPAGVLQWAMRFWGRTMLKIAGIRLELEGESTLETRAPRVIVFNHQSAVDMMLTAAVAAPGMLAVGKREIVFVPFVNLAWWALGFMTVDRKRPRKMVASIAEVAEAISRDGRSFLVSPEGTRTKDGSILPFKRGPFQIAVRAQAPVYPLVIWGAFECMPRTAWLPKPGTIRVRYLTPIETRGEKDDEALAERVRAEIVRVYEAS